jgi:hypothetical protein
MPSASGDRHILPKQTISIFIFLSLKHKAEGQKLFALSLQLFAQVNQIAD